MPPGWRGERASERLHPGRQMAWHAASVCLLHANPRIDVSGKDSTTAGPMRIRYDITFDSITQDSTQLPIVLAETQPFRRKWPKSRLGLVDK
jgi:hypothetical protein